MNVHLLFVSLVTAETINRYEKQYTPSETRSAGNL